MNGYELSHNFFEWSFENPNKVAPAHVALYFFCINQCNKLGWKEKFGLPMQMAKDAIGISNYRTYSKTFNDLVEWGFITVYEKSKNQWSATIIGIAKNTKANTNALDKATSFHMQDQSTEHPQKQVRGSVCIDKPNNNKTKEPNNNKTLEQRKIEFSQSLNPFLEPLSKEYGLNLSKQVLNKFYLHWTQMNEGGKKFLKEKQKTWDLAARIRTWVENEKTFSNGLLKNYGKPTNHNNQSVDGKRGEVLTVASESFNRLAKMSGSDGSTGDSV